LSTHCLGKHAHRLAALVGVFQAVHRHVVEELRAPYLTPLRANIRCGALVMLSMPPATITLALPAASMSCANIMARMPLPHILVSVTAPVLSGRPARRMAWRAGAWPWPAIRQLPNSTSSTASPGTPARATAAWMATAPSSQAARLAKSPSRPPMGVRAADTMTMGSDMVGSSVDRWRAGSPPPGGC
jgi:hypothetical protein